MRTFDPSLVLLLVLALLVAVFAGPADAQEAPLLEAPTEVEPVLAPRETVYESQHTGLRVILPLGWTGSEIVNEETLPARATYRWEATEGPLAGAVIVVERAVGLNPVLQERWTRGQVSAGYYGLRPTGAVAPEGRVFGTGAAIEIGAGDRAGRAYFTQRGQVFWAVHVAAPAAALEASPGLLDRLAGGIRVSAQTAALSARSE